MHVYLIVIRIEVQAIDTHFIIKNIDPTSIYKRAKETGRYDKTTLTTRTLTTYDNIKSKTSELCHTATETKTETVYACISVYARERETDRKACGDASKRQTHTRDAKERQRRTEHTP